MQRSNTGWPGATDSGPAGGDAEVLARMAAGALGFTVRCTPRRRTVLASVPDGRILFVKLRRGRSADARAEWHWLHLLPMLGIDVPPPVAFLRLGARRTLLCTAAAPGRPCDAWLAAARRSGDPTAALRFACDRIAPRIRCLHDQGIVCRDLYWNHLFAPGLDSERVVLLDVERVFRPRLWLRRWIVKDLAGLLSSVPGDLPTPKQRLRFLRSYLGPDWDDRRLRRRLGRDVYRKALRIRAHEPRYG